MRVAISRRLLLFIILILLILAVPLTLYLVSQQQDIRQRAAGGADLIITGFQLTDAGGNVRTTFGVNQDIYVRVRIKNQGTATGTSTDDFTYTQVYSSKPSIVAPNTVSPDGIYLRNGEFGSQTEKIYESRWAGSNSSVYKGKIYFSKSTAGNYTARVYVNFDGKVSETNLNNNQEATVQYKVTNELVERGVYLDGAESSSPPTGFASRECGEQGSIGGVSVCYALGPVGGKGVVKFTNNSSSAKTVGAALYRAYYDFPSNYPSCSPSSCPEQFIWAWTQTIYSAKVISISPGETTYISLPAPSCNWQIDAFTGSTILLSFHPPSQTYGQLGRLIGGGWLEQYGGINACKPDVPEFPSPTPTLTVTPTLPPNEPTPTLTPVPPSETPTPTIPSATPSPTVPACPLPSQVPNVRIECPFCGQ